MNVKMTQWLKHGDHPLVTRNQCAEVDYEEAASKGYGFINTFTLVAPGSYIVEINGVYVAVISAQKAQEILEKDIAA